MGPTGVGSGGSAGDQLTVEVHHDLAGLRADWEQVWADTPDATVYQSWRWASTAHQRLGFRDRPHVLVVRDGDRVRAIAPLARMRWGAGPLRADRYVALGQEQTDYGGFLLGPDPQETAGPVLRHLEELVASTGATIVLPRLLTGHATYRALTEHNWSSAVALTETARTTCPYLDLTTFDDPLAEVRRRAKRRSLPRLLRRLSDQHDVRFTYHDPDPAVLEQVFAVHHRRWEAKAGAMQGLFSTPRLRDFVRQLVTTLDAQGQVRVSTLTADGEPIAVCLGYVARGWYHYHKPAFEPAFAPYKPGHQLIWHLLEAAVADGVTRFDFGRGTDSYKDQWSTGADRAASLRLAPAARTPMAELADRAAASWRVRRQQLPLLPR